MLRIGETAFPREKYTIGFPIPNSPENSHTRNTDRATYVCNDNDKKGHEFEREQWGFCARVFREEKEAQNNVIVISKNKRNDFLKLHAVLPEDSSSVPSTHARWFTQPVTPTPRNLTRSSGLLEHPHTCDIHSNIYTKNKYKF